MQQFQTLARRAAGFLLAVLLVVPAFAAEPSETAADRQKDLDTLYHEVKSIIRTYLQSIRRRSSYSSKRKSRNA